MFGRNKFVLHFACGVSGRFEHLLQFAIDAGRMPPEEDGIRDNSDSTICLSCSTGTPIFSSSGFTIPSDSASSDCEQMQGGFRHVPCHRPGLRVGDGFLGFGGQFFKSKRHGSSLYKFNCSRRRSGFIQIVTHEKDARQLPACRAEIAAGRPAMPLPRSDHWLSLLDFEFRVDGIIFR